VVRWVAGAGLVVCFLSTIPLEKLFDFGGEQMALYCGKVMGRFFFFLRGVKSRSPGQDLGDLVVVTLNK